MALPWLDTVYRAIDGVRDAQRPILRVEALSGYIGLSMTVMMSTHSGGAGWSEENLPPDVATAMGRLELLSEEGHRNRSSIRLLETCEPHRADPDSAASVDFREHQELNVRSIVGASRSHEPTVPQSRSDDNALLVRWQISVVRRSRLVTEKFIRGQNVGKPPFSATK
jgi:hypothetical protein